MKAYYFFHSLKKQEYQFFLDKVILVKSIDDISRIIDTYFYRIWDIDEGRTKKTAFIEAFVFLRIFLREKLWNIQDIEWVFAKNFLIYNSDLYVFSENNKYEKIRKKVLFVTSRDSWKNPFFLFLSKFFEGRVDLIKPNFEVIDTNTDKLTNISKIWKLREKNIWDIIIPFLRNKSISQIEYLLNFVNENIGPKVILKNNFWVEWKSVRAIDLLHHQQEQQILLQQIKKDFFDIGTGTINNPYFVKYYNIVKEFRIYYTFSPLGQIQIYSIKNRENSSIDKSSIFWKSNFSTENLKVIWKYMHPNDFYNQEPEVYKSCVDIIPLLWLEIWVLEMCREKDGSIRFIEINPLWWALMHKGSDERMLENYYEDMWWLALEDMKFIIKV